MLANRRALLATVAAIGLLANVTRVAAAQTTSPVASKAPAGQATVATTTPAKPATAAKKTRVPRAEDVLPLTCAQAWVAGGSTDAGFLEIVKLMGRLSIANRRVTFPDTREAGLDAGNGLVEDCKADPDALLYAVVDKQVRRVTGGPPVGAIADRVPDRPLTGTYWTLRSYGSTQAAGLVDQGEPHMILHTAGQRLSGFGGCNQLAGKYTVEGATVSFGGVASTRKMCAAGMEQEQGMLNALRDARAWKTRGNTLELLDGAGLVVATFEAVDLR